MSGDKVEELQNEVAALRKTVEALRAMMEIRENGSASWKIPERYERRHTNTESLRTIPLHK